MIYLIQCLDKIKVGWTNQSFEHYLNWLQRRLPWPIKVLAIREGTIEEERDFHRENAEYRAAFGGNEWYPLEMLNAAREFMRLPEPK
jgi:hypothetical protein